MSSTQNDDPTRRFSLALLDAEFDALRDEDEICFLKHIISAIAIYSPWTFQDAANWLSRELASASKYERPEWVSEAFLSDPSRSEISGASHQEGMAHLLELAAHGPEEPRVTFSIGFRPQEIKSFVMRRIEKESQPNTSTQNSEAHKTGWPWGDYETDLLRHLKEAAAKWWVNFEPSDPTTAPTNAQVIDWLKDERNLSQNKAEAIAMILRADNLPAGPRR